MQYVNAFHIKYPVADNAFMHIQDYPTPAGRALADLCRQKKSSGDYQLMKEKSGKWRVNANALNKAMAEEGIELPQPTITRLLLGKVSQPKTVKALADFFGVPQAVVRGEKELAILAPAGRLNAELLKRFRALRPAHQILAVAVFEAKITDLEDEATESDLPSKVRSAQIKSVEAIGGQEGLHPSRHRSTALARRR